MNGIVLIDKQKGCTSHDVVNRWRKLANTKRVGHLGTLDPMATGLLVLVTGTATRLARFFDHAEKTYAAEITLGAISDSYDLDGEVRQTGAALPDEATVVAALDQFRGSYLQTPPPISAKKINGVPAYKLARRQETVELKAVEVHVRRLDVEYVSLPRLRVIVASSAGTYIRSIAHDLGQVLGCGAVLSSLRRTRVGNFSVTESRTLEDLTKMAADGRLGEVVVPSGEALSQFPGEHFDTIVEGQIRQGREFRTSPFVVASGAPYVKALSRSGDLIAIGELRLPNVYHPMTVL